MDDMQACTESRARGALLIADDEVAVRESLAEVLREDGHHVTCVADGLAAIAALDTQAFDLVLSDVRMPGADGLAVLQHSREVAPQTLVLLMTAYASMETGAEALRRGAHAYVAKPLIFDDLQHKIQHLLRHRQLAWENELLRGELWRQWAVDTLVGQSPAMREVLAAVRQLAPAPTPVLITGERGVGKEVVALAIHRLSSRHDGLFLRVYCSARSEEELTCQLFGYVPGAFPAALSVEEGLFQRARGGTLFFDEIADLPAGLQAKLLHAMERKEIFPLGSMVPTRVDVRVIAATEQDLRSAVDGGRFRDDLHCRLWASEITVPPLRQRREDIPGLIDHFVRIYNRDLKRTCRGVDSAALEHLFRLPWPGNVRELANLIEYGMLNGGNDWLTLRDLPDRQRAEDGSTSVPPPAPGPLHTGLRTYEKAHIEATLAAVHHDKRIAARQLGLSLSSLYRKIAELKIDLRAPH